MLTSSGYEKKVASHISDDLHSQQLAQIVYRIQMVSIGEDVVLAEHVLCNYSRRFVEFYLEAGQLRGRWCPAGFFPCPCGASIAGDKMHCIAVACVRQARESDGACLDLGDVEQT